MSEEKINLEEALNEAWDKGRESALKAMVAAYKKIDIAFPDETYSMKDMIKIVEMKALQ